MGLLSADWKIYHNRQLRKELRRKIAIFEIHKAQQIAHYDSYIGMISAGNTSLTSALQDYQPGYVQTHEYAATKRGTSNLRIIDFIRREKTAFANEMDQAIAELQEQLHALG